MARRTNYRPTHSHNTNLKRRTQRGSISPIMAKRATNGRDSETIAKAPAAGKPSSLLDTRVVYCGDNLEQLAKLPDKCVDLIYIDPPFNSNRNYEVFWGETKEAFAETDSRRAR